MEELIRNITMPRILELTREKARQFDVTDLDSDGILKMERAVKERLFGCHLLTESPLAKYGERIKKDIGYIWKDYFCYLLAQALYQFDEYIYLLVYSIIDDGVKTEEKVYTRARVEYMNRIECCCRTCMDMFRMRGPEAESFAERIASVLYFDPEKCKDRKELLELYMCIDEIREAVRDEFRYNGNFDDVLISAIRKKAFDEEYFPELNDKMSFQEAFIYLMKKTQVTQYRLEKEIGIPQQTASNWMKGKGTPPKYSQENILETLKNIYRSQKSEWEPQF